MKLEQLDYDARRLNYFMSTWTDQYFIMVNEVLVHHKLPFVYPDCFTDNEYHRAIQQLHIDHKFEFEPHEFEPKTSIKDMPPEIYERRLAGGTADFKNYGGISAKLWLPASNIDYCRALFRNVTESFERLATNLHEYKEENK